ncbi:MAG: hypothetical protein WKF87_11060 [Chryseolinea sp.]
MDLRDFIVTPVVIIIVYALAYVVRPRVTDHVTRLYFIPALTVKIIGALAVGLVYQFYYNGGDTFNYHTHGSRHVWEAFMDSPQSGLKLLFGDGKDETGIYSYSSKILFFSDPSSYTIVRIAGLADLFTFSTYSATAVLFAVFSFVGMWMFFLTFYEEYPHLSKWLAGAAFFIPSVFFWGSGLLKDTITLGCLGMATHCVHKIFIRRQFAFWRWLVLGISFWGLYQIKIYILLVYLPAAIIWIFLANIQRLQSLIIKIMIFPFMAFGAGALAYMAMIKAGEDNAKYSIESVGKTAQVTAYDIRYFTGRDAGSGYTLGELDGSLASMFALAPLAINVSLFRPYLWEVNNPLMLLSAIESFLLLMACVIILFKQNVRLLKGMINPDSVFSLSFSLVFAFAVGVSTYNFGTLVRYKIPMLPFLVLALVLVTYYSKRERNVEAFDATE